MMQMNSQKVCPTNFQNWVKKKLHFCPCAFNKTKYSQGAHNNIIKKYKTKTILQWLVFCRDQIQKSTVLNLKSTKACTFVLVVFSCSFMAPFPKLPLVFTSVSVNSNASQSGEGHTFWRRTGRIWLNTVAQGKSTVTDLKVGQSPTWKALGMYYKITPSSPWSCPFQVALEPKISAETFENNTEPPKWTHLQQLPLSNGFELMVTCNTTNYNWISWEIKGSYYSLYVSRKRA